MESFDNDFNQTHSRKYLAYDDAFAAVGEGLEFTDDLRRVLFSLYNNTGEKSNPYTTKVLFPDNTSRKHTFEILRFVRGLGFNITKDGENFFLVDFPQTSDCQL